MEIQIHELWAHSLTDRGAGVALAVKQNVTRFKTVYLSHRRYGPAATAQICLSRVDGPGTARCVIYGYSFFVQTNPDPLYDFPGSYSGPVDTMAVVLSGPGSIAIGNARSITFLVAVSNMFAYATATIFVERVGLLRRLLTSATELLRIGPRHAQAGGERRAAGGSVTHAAYDRRSGEILQLHEAVASPGVRLPAEAELSRVATGLFSRSAPASEHVAIASVSGHRFDPGARYSVDLKTHRLLVGVAHGSGDAAT